MSELRMIPPRFQPAPGVTNGLQHDGPVGIGTTPQAGYSVNAALPIRAPADTSPAADTVLTGNLTLTSSSPTYLFRDPGAGNRDVTLNATTEVEGHSFVIQNVGAANNLVVKDSAAATLTTLTPGDGATVIRHGTTWRVL
jgi:hypothetical protein